MLGQLALGRHGYLVRFVMHVSPRFDISEKWRCFIRTSSRSSSSGSSSCRGYGSRMFALGPTTGLKPVTIRGRRRAANGSGSLFAWYFCWFLCLGRLCGISRQLEYGSVLSVRRLGVGVRDTSLPSLTKSNDIPMLEIVLS